MNNNVVVLVLYIDVEEKCEASDITSIIIIYMARAWVEENK